MYDPSVGRWLTEDPIGFNAGDMDLYRYVGNDPTDSIDPTGLDSAALRTVQAEFQSDMIRTLERDQLRRQFPQGIAPALNDAKGMKQNEKDSQAHLKVLESRLEAAQEKRRAHAGNKAIMDAIDKEIALLERVITLQKASLARATRRATIVDEVNNLKKGAKDYDRVYSQKEFQYLRSLKAELDSLPEFLALELESLQAKEAVNQAIRNARKK